MMADWSGFTDSELKRLKQQTSRSKLPEANIMIDRPECDQLQQTGKDFDLGIPKTAVSNKPLPSWSSQEVKSSVVTNVKSEKIVNDNKIENGAVESEEIVAKDEEDATKDFVVKVVSQEEIPGKQLMDNIPERSTVTMTSPTVTMTSHSANMTSPNIAQLQESQKLIEEQNKRKKELIAGALDRKFKQTMSESARLKNIKQQLSELDAELQLNVDALRVKIDEATYDYAQAEQRFSRAESEYVTAKLDYHRKREVKDLLTEQLYQIIQDSEIRKAKRLEELMTKLVEPPVSN